MSSEIKIQHLISSYGLFLLRAEEQDVDALHRRIFFLS